MSESINPALYPFTHGGTRLTGEISPNCPTCGNDRAIADYDDYEHKENYAGNKYPVGRIYGECTECSTTVAIERTGKRVFVEWEETDE